jgi:bacteriocin-like protein
MDTTKTPAIRELTADELKQIAGGLLLPAVQSAREAARRG